MTVLGQVRPSRLRAVMSAISLETDNPCTGPRSRTSRYDARAPPTKLDSFGDLLTEVPGRDFMQHDRDMAGVQNPPTHIREGDNGTRNV
jgi:hypothetical protein